MGVLWPEPHQIDAEDEPLIIAKGPNQGENLMLVEGNTPQSLARGACKRLYTKEETMGHMLSPKTKPRTGVVQRDDFSPVRKNQLKGSLIFPFS